MKKSILILSIGSLSLVAQAQEQNKPKGAAPAMAHKGFAQAPEGALLIERAQAPLYRDPIFDGAADPSVVYEESDGSWLVYYTQRRANVQLPGVAWGFRLDIGVARSTNKGRSWEYAGIAKGLSTGSQLDTFWAPHVFKHEGRYHMFVTYINKILDHWGKGEPTLRHYTSKDGMNWEFSDVVDTGSDNIIDGAVVKLLDDTWLLVFRDDNKEARTGMCTSTDLKTWTRLEQTVGDRRHEAPVVMHWKGKYWMLTDDWQGLGVYESDDGLTYKRNGTILGEGGKRPDDGIKASHPGVAIVGDRAFIFYHVHAGQLPDKPKWAAHNTYTHEYKRTSLQIAELELVDGKLVCDRDKYSRR